MKPPEGELPPRPPRRKKLHKPVSAPIPGLRRGSVQYAPHDGAHLVYSGYPSGNPLVKIPSDSWVSPDHFVAAQPVPPERRYAFAKEIVSVDQVIDWMENERIFGLNPFFAEEQKHLALHIIPEEVALAEIYPEKCVANKYQGGTHNYILYNQAGQALGVTERFFLVGRDFDEINNAYTFKQLQGPWW